VGSASSSARRNFAVAAARDGRRSAGEARALVHAAKPGVTVQIGRRLGYVSAAVCDPQDDPVDAWLERDLDT
jgi:hypothetical protein